MLKFVNFDKNAQNFKEVVIYSNEKLLWEEIHSGDENVFRYFWKCLCMAELF